MNAVAIIPVRLESSRLSEKALKDICGLPMFVHTCKRALLAESLDKVYLATDSNKIAKIAKKMAMILKKTEVERVKKARAAQKDA